MKTIVISDIHGNLEALNSIIEKIHKYHIDKLIILGDFCSYYDDSLEIAEKLKPFKDIIIAVKGNVDTLKFINQCNLDLPTKRNVVLNNHLLTITHGHIFNPYNLTKNYGDIFLSGHTHRKYLEKQNNIIIANPGSIGIPRDGSKSYILIDNERITLYDIDDNILKYIELD